MRYELDFSFELWHAPFSLQADFQAESSIRVTLLLPDHEVMRC